MNKKLSFRVLSANELDVFIEFVRENYSDDHSYVLYPDLANHFYADGDKLNIYAAFLEGRLIGVWPFLFYNQNKTNAAGCLFLFKPVADLPFIGQSFMKKFIEDLNPEGFFTAGLLERLIPYYSRMKHACGQFKQFYWQSSMPCSSLASTDISSIEGYSAEQGESFLFERFPDCDFLPRKDFWFLKKTYLENPSQSFQVFRGSKGQNSFVFVTSTYLTPIGRVLRLYDYFGKRDALPLVLAFLQHKAMQDNCIHTDAMVAGIDDNVFTDAGFALLDPESSEVIVPNNFFPFQNVNSKVFYGVRLNNVNDANTPVVLFKGTGDQIVPRQIRKWNEQAELNIC